MKKDQTLPKSERLKNKMRIASLFKRGNPSFFAEPFRFSWIKKEPDTAAVCEVLISVSSKKFPSSVDRNRIKRQIRELYRHNKSILTQSLIEKNISLDLAIMYQGVMELDYHLVEPKLVKALKRIAKQLE